MINMNRCDRSGSVASKPSSERGQTAIFVVIGLGIVFLAVLGFAVDFGNLWFHRQRAQSAADAACTAAVMDMLYNVAATPATAAGGFTTGTDFNCKDTPGAWPCSYASLNGYNGTGLVANTESNSVDFKFSSSFTGIDPLSFPLTPGAIYAVPASGFVQTTVTDRIRTSFFGLVSSSRTMDVPAKATCAIVLTTSPIPILILNPTQTDTFKYNGTGLTSVYGGPPDSIQVNSTNAGAFIKNGNSGLIDLHLGGPNAPPTGSNMHVAQVQTDTPTSGQTCSGVDLCYGTTGGYGTHFPIADPLASLEAPEQPTWTSATMPNGGSVLVDSDATATAKGNPIHGCPAPAGTQCREYYPGYYPAGITVPDKPTTSNYAIFAPGIYYVKGGVQFNPNSCVRPANDIGDGSGGTFFYFADNNSISVDANSGCNKNSNTLATNFPVESGTGIFPFGVFCDATALANEPANLKGKSIDGSVLLAPCGAPNAALSMCAPNCDKNGGTGYGDSQGVHPGQQRGILFMQNRDQILPSKNMPSWQGGGNFLVSGTMYFHQCTAGNGADQGGAVDTCIVPDPSTTTGPAYQDQLSLAGNPSGTSYVLGDIIVDKLQINGNASLVLDLSPTANFVIYKATLVR